MVGRSSHVLDARGYAQTKVRRRAITDSCSGYSVFLRVIGVFRGYLAGRNHRIRGKHGIKCSKNEPFLKMNHDPVIDWFDSCGAAAIIKNLLFGVI